MQERRLSYNRFMRTKKPINPDTCARIDTVWHRLASHYGSPKIEPNGDPIGQLVQTVLSQHTTDASADHAFTNLKRSFPSWSDVAAAPQGEVAHAIRSAGLANQKASTIQTALRELGSSDLRGLTNLPVPEARERLTAIRGIGDKTASCVLLFALGMPAQPVDTHIERVSKRIGLTNEATSASGIQDVLETCLPADRQTMFAFHIDLIRHGRDVCVARTPKCSQCFLNDLCDYYQESVRRVDS